MIRIEFPFIYVDTPSSSLVFEIKEYLDESTPFNKGKKYVTQRYYGPKTDEQFEPSKPRIRLGGSNQEYNSDFVITSTFGDCNNAESSVLLENSNNTYINRFFYKESRIVSGGVFVEGPHARKAKETLEIIELDDVLNIELHTYYSIFDDSNVIAVKKQLVNKGDCLKIDRLFSLELPINSIKLKVYSYDGTWLFERTRHETDLTAGTFVIDSKVGSSSHKHNPFIEVLDKQNGLYYGFNLIYSGNHKETIEVDAIYHSKVMVGINDYLFNYEVKNGESFTTPEAIMVVASSLDEITSEMHRFALNHIIDQKFYNNPRPIIFNNWEGTGMNIDEKSLLEMAEIAERVGIEQFVMDDGWFKGRVNDLHALGDWVIDENKFPSGLGKFANQVRKFNLKFGIWVEPEMISIDSDCYRNHPEYASIVPNREPIERRHQLMIDMASKDVQNYLVDCLLKVFREVRPDYVKWDYNRFMSDNYSNNGIKKGEYMHKFILGTYKVIERIQKEFPDILFESCSSGGGRYDLGMLYYMPQTWASDDTNTHCRTFITCGTLAGYPQSSFGAHVSRDGCPDPTDTYVASLEDRFNLNAIGAFGYEFDFRKYSLEEQEIMKKQTEWYKKHRNLLQYGNYYVIDNVFDDDRYYSYIVTSDNKEEAIMMVLQTNENVPAKHWRAKNLISEWNYLVKIREQYNLTPEQSFERVISGKELMEQGLDLGSLATTSDIGKFHGISTRIIHLIKQ